jgi:hypothetical protein
MLQLRDHSFLQSGYAQNRYWHCGEEKNLICLPETEHDSLFVELVVSHNPLPTEVPTNTSVIFIQPQNIFRFVIFCWRLGHSLQFRKMIHFLAIKVNVTYFNNIILSAREVLVRMWNSTCCIAYVPTLRPSVKLCNNQRCVNLQVNC